MKRYATFFALMVGLILVSAELFVEGRMSAASARSYAPATSAREQAAKAEQCSQLLATTGAKARLLRSYHTNGDDLFVEVGPGFYAADFRAKESLTATLLCAETNGRMDESISRVDFQDWRTHKYVASYTRAMGLQVNE